MQLLGIALGDLRFEGVGESPYLRIGAQNFERIVVSLTILLYALCKFSISLDIVVESLLMPSASFNLSKFTFKLI